MATRSNPFEPDLGQAATPTYIKNPVAEPNAIGAIAGAIKDLAPGALNIYSNIQSKELIEGVDEAIMTYEQGREGFMASELQREKADRKWDDFDINDKILNETGAENPMNEINLIEKAHAQEVQKFTKAKEQGLLSESEVLARITQLTRQAVAKNPWLEDRFYSTVQNYLSRSGISDVLEYRMKTTEDRAKAAAEERKRLETLADKYNVSYDSSVPSEVLLSKVNEEKDRKLAEDIVEGQLQNSKALDEMRARDLLRTGKIYNGHVMMLRRDTRDFIAKYQQAGNNPNAVGEVTFLLEQQKQTRLNEWRIKLGSVLDTPQAREAMKTIEDDYESAISALKAVKTGAEAADFLSKKLSAVTSAEQLVVSGAVNRSALNLFGTVFSMLPKAHQTRIENAMGQLSQLSTAGASLFGPVSDASPLPVQGAVKAGAPQLLLDGMLSSPANSPIWLQRDAMANIIDNTNAAIASGKLTGDESRGAINGMLATVAKNHGNIKNQDMGLEFYLGMDKVISTGIADSVPNLAREMNSILSTATKGEKVELDVLPNGALKINVTAQENKDQIEGYFTTRYITHINNALDSFAAINGMTREQAAPEFYGTYFGEELRKDPDLQKLMGISTEQPSSVKSKPVKGTPPGEWSIQSSGKQSSNVPANVAEATAQTRAAQQTRDMAAVNLKREELKIVQTRIKEIDKQLNSPKVSANEKSRLAREYDELKATESALNRELQTRIK